MIKWRVQSWKWDKNDFNGRNNFWKNTKPDPYPTWLYWDMRFITCTTAHHQGVMEVLPVSFISEPEFKCGGVLVHVGKTFSLFWLQRELHELL